MTKGGVGVLNYPKKYDVNYEQPLRGTCALSEGGMKYFSVAEQLYIQPPLLGMPSIETISEDLDREYL